jgi:predicted RNase H-like HicB family nuclease
MADDRTRDDVLQNIRDAQAVLAEARAGGDDEEIADALEVLEAYREENRAILAERERS